MKDLKEIIAADLTSIREKKPLIHHITNFVVMNETANITLCLGALPVMAHSKEEVEEMVGFAGALVLNIGTLTPELIESMIIAGRKANELGVPVVLDPVGAGATALRTDSCKRILDEVKVAVIRGNSAEIGILSGAGGEIKGVEAVGSSDGIAESARELALREECVVSVTGATDVVTDGSRRALIRNGHPMMAMITGTGCMSTTVTAGFAAVQNDYFLASVGALVFFGLAGESAASSTEGRPGSFHASLYDAVYATGENEIREGARCEVNQTVEV